MYLLDTNIWLELLLKQEKTEEVVEFFDFIKDSEIYISTFSLYSICILLGKYLKFDTINKFVKDLIENDVEVLGIKLNDINEITKYQEDFKLDFDDAFQYYIAKSNKLILVSYDKDFDKTPELRITPRNIMSGF